jgi:hypothetical protein
MVLAASVFTIVYFTSSKEKTSTLAGHREFVSLREHKITCSPDNVNEIEAYPKCISYCKRLVTDNLISEQDALNIHDAEKRIFSNSNDGESKKYNINLNSVANDEITKSLHDTIKARHLSFNSHYLLLSN